MTKYYARVISEYGDILFSAAYYDSIEKAKRQFGKYKSRILLKLEEGEKATLCIYEEKTNKRVYAEEL